MTRRVSIVDPGLCRMLAIIVLAASALPGPAVAQEETARAEISVSVGETFDGVVFDGEPLVVRIRLTASPRAGTNSILLRSPSGPWTDLVRVSLVGTDGRAVGIPATVSGTTTERSVRLAARRHAGGTWHWSRSQLAALAPGVYSVVGRIETPEGVVESEPARVELARFPAAPTPEQAVYHARAVSRGLAMDGDTAGAETALDAWLERQPRDADAHMARARLRRQRGDLVGALLDANEAIGPTPSSDAPPPAVDRLAFRSELLRDLISSGPASDKTGAPAASSRPAVPAPRTPQAVSQTALAGSSPSSGAAHPDGLFTFAGVWSTNFGAVTLVVNGNNVTGTYPRNGGNLVGTLDGNVLRFEWTQTNNRGRGIFRLAADGKSFTGTFTYGTADPEASRNTWNGTRTN
jgi:hypothetical protein